MHRKDRIDAFGAASLLSFAALMGLNQVVIKVTNDGLQPVFAAGLRSALAVVCVLLLITLRGRRPDLRREAAPSGVLLGIFFALEFALLFQALDLTSVARTSILFYSMPVWTALGAHFLLPGERLSFSRLIGLILAFGGVAWVIASSSKDQSASLAGDIMALLASMCWASIALTARIGRVRETPAESQLLWQLMVSAPILLLTALFFGPALRDPQFIHWAGLAFQVIAVATLAFAMWFWLLSVYPAGQVAAFGFFAPIFGIAFGWALLSEPVPPSLLGALVLVVVGLWLITRPRHSA